MTEHDFSRVIVQVVVGGLAVVAIGTTLLYLAFRALEDDKKGQRNHVIYAIATLVFVLAVCAALFVWSR